MPPEFFVGWLVLGFAALVEALVLSACLAAARSTPVGKSWAGEDAFYMEIPGGRPVLLHCRQGVIVPGAYERVKELRPDIPEISYIDGSPLFDEYNAAVSGHQK